MPTPPAPPHRPAGFLVALWLSFVRFVGSLFSRSPSPAALPVPVTAKPTAAHARPTSAPVRVTHQRINVPHGASVKEPTPLKRPTSAASSPISSTARTSPACRSRSATPKRTPMDPEHIFHPPASPFPNISISLSGIFATPPSLASPRLAPQVAIAPLSLASPPGVPPFVSPVSPSPFRASLAASGPSIHTLHSRSPCCTPRTPSSAVIVRFDRSSISPTTMSDGSLEVISLGDRRGFVGSPINVPDIARLPSPWSPIGKATSSDVWMSVGGLLVNATGPVDDNASQSQDDSAALRTIMLSSLTSSRISCASLYSSSSALDALGISVFVNLDGIGGGLSSQDTNVISKDDQTSVPKLNEVRDENRPTLVTDGPQTPRKRRETLPSVTKSHASVSRAIKCLSTPLTKLDNVDVSHLRSTSSISSLAYEFRLGMLADGKSMTAIENIISLLDQASPESMPLHDAMQPMETC